MSAAGLWTLLPASAVYGIVSAFAFRRFTDGARIRRSVNRALAHAMEMALFLDSPMLVLRAQRDLLVENARLLRLIWLPTAMLAVLFALLFPTMDTVYGHAGLRVGEAAVVTMPWRDAATAQRLEAPDGISVETDGVRVPRLKQISWRVRALRPISVGLKFRVDGRAAGAMEVDYPAATVAGLPWLLWFLIGSSASAVLCGVLWKW